MRTTKVLVCLVATAGLWAALPLEAQTTTSLIGTVTDKSGAAVPRAQVTAVNTGTNLMRSAETNSAGEYRFDFLPVGVYDVGVSAQGFKKTVQKAVTLEINVTARVDASLDVGAI